MTTSLKADDTVQLGEEMHRLISELYPICRSITGDGVRKTLHILQQLIPIEVHEVPSGTPVFDWTVPKEWNIRDAYVLAPTGERVIDFKQSNLHVLNYSIPVHQRMSFSELKEHLFSIPEYPDWIPYRTSYYKESWGFCLAHNSLCKLVEGEYEVCIDSSLENGYLTYGEYYLPGKTDEEVLFSCHICHPSLCNDNLSGIALATFLAKHLSSQPRYYSYRFLFIPGTIGSITWLCLNEDKIHRVKHGLVISGVGDPGKMTYKKSRRSNAEIDKVVAYVLNNISENYQIEEFSPYGYDERQYCSPGFNLPVGRLTRTPFGQYPEYHTSADDLKFVNSNALAQSLVVYAAVVDVLEHNFKYLSTSPKCEPQLGRRGLYGNLGGQKLTKADEMAMLWVLNLSDGDYNLLDITERSGLEFAVINKAANTLFKSGLLKKL